MDNDLKDMCDYLPGLIRHPAPLPRASGYQTTREFQECIGLRPIARDRCDTVKQVVLCTLFLVVSTTMMYLWVCIISNGFRTASDAEMTTLVMGILSVIIWLLLLLALLHWAGFGRSKWRLCDHLSPMAWCPVQPIKAHRLDTHNNDGYIDIDV